MDKPNVTKFHNQGWGLGAQLQGTLGPALDKLPGQVQYLQEHWLVSSSQGMGNQGPTCALVEYGIARGFVHPQPRLGSQFTVLLRSG